MRKSARQRDAVYTGMFDPVHLGHVDLIRRGSRVFDRLVVGVGINPDKAPFFSPEERVRLLQDVAAPYQNVEVRLFQGLAVRFVREVVPYMRARRWGRIVGIQSMSVKQPVDGIDMSNGLRPGVAGLMKAIMPDLAKDGITINLVLPGMFLTSRIIAGAGRSPEEDQALQEQLAPVAAAIPLGRLGQPIELGNLVAFLASQQASYITGAVYQVDGGKIRSNV